MQLDGNTDPGTAAKGNTRTAKMRRKNALWTERASWMTHWQEISEVQQPRLGRFFVTDRNKGDKSRKRHQTILDNTAMRASATLAAGMMSGMTSPARPWFRLATPDQDMMEFAPVKNWLHRVNQQMLRIFNSSNTYRSLHACYEELGLFGTWADFVMDDFDNVIHHFPMTIGEYAIGTDYKGNVDTLVREFQMTVGQMVGQFGMENCSMAVQNMAKAGNLDAWVDVVHMVDPRKDRDIRRADNLNMPFRSCYFEPGADNWDKYLRESGFKRFPALCPRWAVTGNDVYGQSPGMECLGDVRQLQVEQLRKGQAIDYQVNPPLAVPTMMKERHLDRLPGGVTYIDGMTQGQGVRSLYEVNLNLQHLLVDIEDVRRRIREAYYADMFLMLAQDTRGQMTATEVAERHEEKLLMLGPVLERLHNELLSPLIEITFDRMVDSGMLTGALEPPPEMQGVDLKIEFVSVLAQAQRAVAASGMDRLMGTVASLAAANPAVLDKIDMDQVVDDYADLYGVNPEIIVDDEKVAQMRAARAEQQQAMQAAAAAPVAVDAAKTASEINPDGLESVMRNLQGYDTLSPAVGQ